jgi:hypothetical protein
LWNKLKVSQDYKTLKDMKPTKCKVFCLDCSRSKMLFDTEKKAQTFIKFNGDEIKSQTGYCPTRTYYCVSCCGFHVTSKTDSSVIVSKTDIVLEKYREYKVVHDEKNRVNKEKQRLRKLEKKKLMK